MKSEIIILLQKTILDHVEQNAVEQTRLFAAQYPDQLNALLVAQRAAVDAGLVTATRNPAVWRLAQLQLQSAAALSTAVPTFASTTNPSSR